MSADLRTRLKYASQGASCAHPPAALRGGELRDLASPMPRKQGALPPLIYIHKPWADACRRLDDRSLEGRKHSRSNWGRGCFLAVPSSDMFGFSGMLGGLRKFKSSEFGLTRHSAIFEISGVVSNLWRGTVILVLRPNVQWSPELLGPLGCHTSR